MEPHAVPSAVRTTPGDQREAARRRARALPPPPGTYAPVLPAQTGPAPQEPAPRSPHGAAPQVSPAVRRCLAEIIDLLDRATALLREQVGESSVAAPPPAPAAEPTPAARLVAVELAVEGHDRAEVRRRLMTAFALADPTRVLDQVFGAGTPGHQRLDGHASPGQG